MHNPNRLRRIYTSTSIPIARPSDFAKASSFELRRTCRRTGRQDNCPFRIGEGVPPSRNSNRPFRRQGHEPTGISACWKARHSDASSSAPLPNHPLRTIRRTARLSPQIGIESCTSTRCGEMERRNPIARPIEIYSDPVSSGGAPRLSSRAVHA